MKLSPLKLGKACTKTILVFNSFLLFLSLFVPYYQSMFFYLLLGLLINAIIAFVFGYAVGHFYNTSQD